MRFGGKPAAVLDSSTKDSPPSRKTQYRRRAAVSCGECLSNIGSSPLVPALDTHITMDIELLRLHKAADVCVGAPISYLRLRTAMRGAELPPWSLELFAGLRMSSIRSGQTR